MKFRFILIVGIFFFGKSVADELLSPYMNQDEYKKFILEVSNAVSSHPEYLSSLDSLKAAGANLKGSKANYLPQIKLIIDSNNLLDKSFEDGSNNLFEKSQSEHKTDARLTVTQLLYDFGATKNDISKSEAQFDAKRAELSSTILNLIYKSVISYINVSAYTIFTNTIEGSYERHTSIKERIELKVEGGLSAPRELSRANARQAEAYAKLITVRQNLSKAISEYRIYFPSSELPSRLPPENLSLQFRTLKESRELMMSGNPDILRAINTLQASLFNVKKVKGQSLPRLDLEIRGSQYNLSEQSDEYDLYSGLNMSYDVYSGGRISALNEQAQAESSAFMNDKDAIIRRVEAEMNNSLQNIKLIPDNIAAYQNAYKANKQSQYFAAEQFQTSNVLLLDLLQTERDFLESSQALIEALRSSQIENYSYMKLTGELGNQFELRITQ
ncbi:TolC family protein [Gammaproteobacteria bacterium]|nr:TolC family protein [Gammaproteobacteria bacterium]MDC0576969.1 TolC family protein [Gammaproteobacteria bacterium]